MLFTETITADNYTLHFDCMTLDSVRAVTTSFISVIVPAGKKYIYINHF